LTFQKKAKQGLLGFIRETQTTTLKKTKPETRLKWTQFAPGDKRVFIFVKQT